MTSTRESARVAALGTDLEAARALVARLIATVAPDIDVDSIEWSDSIVDVADIDSLDFLRLVALTSDTTGIVVKPRDYVRLATLDGFARYLTERRADQQGTCDRAHRSPGPSPLRR